MKGYMSNLRDIELESLFLSLGTVSDLFPRKLARLDSIPIEVSDKISVDRYLSKPVIPQNLYSLSIPEVFTSLQVRKTVETISKRVTSLNNIDLSDVPRKIRIFQEKISGLKVDLDDSIRIHDPLELSDLDRFLTYVSVSKVNELSSTFQEIYKAAQEQLDENTLKEFASTTKNLTSSFQDSVYELVVVLTSLIHDEISSSLPSTLNSPIVTDIEYLFNNDSLENAQRLIWLTKLCLDLHGKDDPTTIQTSVITRRLRALKYCLEVQDFERLKSYLSFRLIPFLIVEYFSALQSSIDTSYIFSFNSWLYLALSKIAAFLDTVGLFHDIVNFKLENVFEEFQRKVPNKEFIEKVNKMILNSDVLSTPLLKIYESYQDGKLPTRQFLEDILKDTNSNILMKLARRSLKDFITLNNVEFWFSYMGLFVFDHLDAYKRISEITQNLESFKDVIERLFNQFQEKILDNSIFLYEVDELDEKDSFHPLLKNQLFLSGYPVAGCTIPVFGIPFLVFDEILYSIEDEIEGSNFRDIYNKFIEYKTFFQTVTYSSSVDVFRENFSNSLKRDHILYSLEFKQEGGKKNMNLDLQSSVLSELEQMPIDTSIPDEIKDEIIQERKSRPSEDLTYCYDKEEIIEENEAPASNLVDLLKKKFSGNNKVNIEIIVHGKVKDSQILTELVKKIDDFSKSIKSEEINVEVSLGIKIQGSN